MTHVVDDFDRADSGTLGGNYTATYFSDISHSVLSGRAANESDGSSRDDLRTNETFANDQWAQITLAADLASSYWVAVMLRSTTASGDGRYWCRASGTNGWVIYKYFFGTISLNSGTLSSGSWSSGDTLRGEVVGTTINMYRNGSLIGTTTDSDISSGRPGIMSQTGGTTDILIEEAIFSDEFNTQSNAPRAAHQLKLMGAM